MRQAAKLDDAAFKTVPSLFYNKQHAPTRSSAAKTIVVSELKCWSQRCYRESIHPISEFTSFWKHINADSGGKKTKNSQRGRRRKYSWDYKWFILFVLHEESKAAS